MTGVLSLTSSFSTSTSSWACSTDSSDGVAQSGHTQRCLPFSLRMQWPQSSLLHFPHSLAMGFLEQTWQTLLFAQSQTEKDFDWASWSPASGTPILTGIWGCIVLLCPSHFSIPLLCPLFEGFILSWPPTGGTTRAHKLPLLAFREVPRGPHVLSPKCVKNDNNLLIHSHKIKLKLTNRKGEKKPRDQTQAPSLKVSSLPSYEKTWEPCFTLVLPFTTESLAVEVQNSSYPSTGAHWPQDRGGSTRGTSSSCFGTDLPTLSLLRASAK